MTHKEILDELRQPVKDLREHIPAVFESGTALSAAALRGATAEEVADALGVTIAMNGGPATVHAPRAFEAYGEFAKRRPL